MKSEAHEGMKFSQGEICLKMVQSTTKARPKAIQQEFFKQEIEAMIADSEYLGLSKEDITFLKNAEFKGTD